MVTSRRPTPALALRRCLGLSLLLATLSLGSAACGGDDVADSSDWSTDEPDAGGEADADTAPVDEERPDAEPLAPRPASIVTVIEVPMPVIAGQRFDVMCEFLDEAGDAIAYPEGEAPPFRFDHSPSGLLEVRSGQLEAQHVGQATIACASPALGLRDETPPSIEIVAGPLHTLSTELSNFQVTAGDTVSASCRGFDAFFNPVDLSGTELRLISDVTNSGVTLEGLDATITTAGFYNLSCFAEGVENLNEVTLEVVPDLPAELIVSVVPDQPVYGIGQIITLSAEAQDRYGNLVPQARITYESVPAGESFGDGRFRFDQDGVYTLRASIDENNATEAPLSREVEIVVNQNGPSIVCTGPGDGTMINHAPNTMLTFTGTVEDSLGVEEVLVNGSPATLDDQGGFSARFRPRFGINFVDVVARDTYGEESVRTCSFLATDTYGNHLLATDDVVSLRLAQDAIDDKGHTATIQSLNDVLLRVLNSDGLLQQIRDAVVNPNTPIGSASCYNIYVIGVEYYGINLGTGNLYRHLTALDLVGGGLDMQAILRGVRVKLRASRKSGFNICVGTFEPEADVSSVTMNLTSDLALNGQTLSAGLRGNPTVTSGNISVSGSNWFSSAVYGAIASLAQGIIRSMIEDAVESAIVDNFDSLLGDLLGNLGTDALSGGIEVPRLDGTGQIELLYDLGFSSLSVNSARMLLGMRTRVRPQTTAIAYPTLGVAVPPGSYLYEPSGGQNTSVSVHLMLLNQALHALWRGGLLEADIGGALFGEDAEGAAVSLRTSLPPVAALNADGSATLMLGGMRLEMVYPGLFDEPVTLSLGATAHTEVAMNNGQLSFSNITLNEFHLSPDEISLNEGTRDILEGFLRGFLQTLLDDALNSALPELPVPSFAISPSLGVYGLPVGGELGLTNPALDSTNRHLILRGNFGVR
ncbi:hypothetical protein EA187_18570 [Lujinxingia sediminis]|uniref:Ig-like domain-containing protein n=1 Tax=Lujinxingia sediminis TaxID=2480984 RepID=A0ABY0CNQ1_9DELT|nr:hypothetical protein [Lujinxingia sediminis]RVU41477.1 hypothetical protein EA187_18570 [Lujinxingia sediminis]